MNVTISSPFADLVREKVASGAFDDAGEVVEAGLRLLDERDRIARLHALLRVGEEDFERGEWVEYTPELMEQWKQVSAENVRNGVVVDDELVP